jgi:ribosomal protein S2
MTQYSIIRKTNNDPRETVMFTYSKRSEAKAALKAMAEEAKAKANPTRWLLRPDGLLFKMTVGGHTHTVRIEAED